MNNTFYKDLLERIQMMEYALKELDNLDYVKLNAENILAVIQLVDRENNVYENVIYLSDSRREKLKRVG